MNDIKIEKLDKANIMVFSKAGETHIMNNICNQDTYSYLSDNSGKYAFVVADGVGSCVNAKEGAEIACKVICDLLQTVHGSSENELKTMIINSWEKHIKTNCNDYCTTVNFCYVFEDSIIIGKIGDGVVVVRNGDHLYKLIDDTVFYTTKTFALGGIVPQAAFSIAIMKREKKQPISVLLMTDGIAKEIDNEKSICFADYIFSQINKLTFKNELENWISELNNGDDKTLLISVLGA